jgi:hypothetical protein
MRLHRTGRHRINRLLVMRRPDVVGPGNIRGHADQVNNDAQGKVRIYRWKNGVANRHVTGSGCGQGSTPCRPRRDEPATTQSSRSCTDI